MIAYKLFRLRKDNTLGSLFLNRRASLVEDTWYAAKDHWKPGFKRRLGWHCLPKPQASHLSTKGRIWCMVEILEFSKETRSLHQGQLWYLAKWMKIVRRLG